MSTYLPGTWPHTHLFFAVLSQRNPHALKQVVFRSGTSTALVLLVFPSSTYAETRSPGMEACVKDSLS